MQEQQRTEQLPENHLIRVLLLQHERVKELFGRVRGSSGDARQAAFDDLRELLAIHETGEEMVLRPISAKAAGQGVADARNQEESEATHLLAELEKLDVGSPEFDEKFRTLEQDVLKHAQSEEQEEFPAVLATHDPIELQELGGKLLAAEAKAPTHPHPTAAGSPTAQKSMGPFAAMLDKARDKFKG